MRRASHEPVDRKARQAAGPLDLIDSVGVEMRLRGCAHNDVRAKLRLDVGQTEVVGAMHHALIA